MTQFSLPEGFFEWVDSTEGDNLDFELELKPGAPPEIIEAFGRLKSFYQKTPPVKQEDE